MGVRALGIGCAWPSRARDWPMSVALPQPLSSRRRPGLAPPVVAEPILPPVFGRDQPEEASPVGHLAGRGPRPAPGRRRARSTHGRSGRRRTAPRRSTTTGAGWRWTGECSTSEPGSAGAQSRVELAVGDRHDAVTLDVTADAEAFAATTDWSLARVRTSSANGKRQRRSPRDLATLATGTPSATR